ncbi:MAG: hypothetical protein Q8S71_03765 [Hydrogenophaga sp.]|nr:hypothetical protein [Hydrogenophaga sp.]
MPAFSAIEQKINAACIKRLSNAQADFGEGLLVDGIFEADPLINFDVQSTIPQFQCLEGSVALVSRGRSVVINSINYTVKTIEPDGAGFTRLELLKA